MVSGLRLLSFEKQAALFGDSNDTSAFIPLISSNCTAILPPDSLSLF
jgi:hypothetical protein